ncbi:MAG TPA: hypothetical protein VGF18_04815, partial [Candidatus Tumulicola sp.]
MHFFNSVDPDDAAFAKTMLADRELSIDPAAAYRRVLVRANRRNRTTRQIVVGLAAAAVIAIGTLVLPIGSYARAFLAIFEPHEFVPIYFANEGNRNSRGPVITNYGSLRVVRSMNRVRMRSARAIADAGFQPKLPPAASLAANARYYYLPGGRINFTFERSRALAYERKTG